MNTNKTAYWFILGVLVLGLNSEYRHGNFVPLHHAAARAHSAFCWASTRVEQTLADAGILTHRRFAAHDLLASKEETNMARVQSELLREQLQDDSELLQEGVQARIAENVREKVRDAMRAQADVLRAEAEIQRAEIEQIRLRARSDSKLVRTADRRMLVICPKTGTRISMNPGAKSADTSTDIDLEENF
jgi:hypothetical protein